MTALAAANMVESHHAEMRLYIDNFKRKHVRPESSQQPPSVSLSQKRPNAVRTAASTGTVLVRLCEKEQRREASSLPHLKKMLTTVRDHGATTADGAGNPNDSERLPVVELRPFTQKQWRPAKSIPSPTWSDPAPLIQPLVPANNYIQRSKTEVFTGDYSAYVDPDRSSFPSRSFDGPCPRAFSVAGERQSNHPKSREMGPSQHSAPMTSHGFASKLERERSTVEEIHRTMSQPAPMQSMQANYGHVPNGCGYHEPEEHPNIHVHGKRIEHPKRISPFYQPPWEYYKKMSRGRRVGDAELFESLCMTLEQMPNSCLDAGIYDAFDRSHTLTSINVHPASVRRRSEKVRMRESEAPHRLGVTNSLDLLSHYGSPINVEQQLNEQLKNTLNNLRRAKPMGSTTLRSVKNSEWNLTQGEQQIYTKRLANTSCSTRSSSRMISPSKRTETMSRRTTELPLELPEQPSPNQIEVRKSKLHKVNAPRVSESSESKERSESMEGDFEKGEGGREPPPVPQTKGEGEGGIVDVPVSSATPPIDIVAEANDESP